MASHTNPTADVELNRRGTTVEIVVRGEVDIATAYLVAEPMDTALSARPEMVVLNLENVDFLEVKLAAVIKRFAARAGALDISFVLLPPRGIGRRTFEHCGLERVPGASSDGRDQVQTNPRVETERDMAAALNLAGRERRRLSAQMSNIIREIATYR